MEHRSTKPREYWNVRTRVEFRHFDDGGPVQMPAGDGYAPYISCEGMPIPLAVRLRGVPADAKHGSAFEVVVELMYHPLADYSCLEMEREFTLLMGNKTVGRGVVLSSLFVG